MLLTPLKPTLEAALRDVDARDPRYRVAAAERLGEVALVRAEGDPELGRTYRERLVAEGEVAEEHRLAHEKLLGLLRDEQAVVRGAAASALGRLLVEREEEVRQACATELRELFETDPAPGVRHAAAAAAIDLAPEDFAFAHGLLRADDPALRLEAVRALFEHASERASEVLVAGYADENDSDVKLAILSGLGSLEELSPEARELLVAQLPLARRALPLALEAALSLAHHGETAAEELLVWALERRQGDGYEVARALGEIASDVGLDALHRRGTGFFTAAFIRLACGAALANRDDPRGDAILRKLVRSRNEAQIHALHAVGKLERRALLEELLKLAARAPANLAERDALEHALEPFRDDPRVPPALLRLQRR